MRTHLLGIAAATMLAVMTASCSSDDTTAQEPPTSPPASAPSPSDAASSADPSPPTSAAPPQIATTSGSASGNRVVSGEADLGGTPISLEIGFVAEWVVGAAIDEGVVWVVVDDGGNTQAFLELADRVDPYPLAVSTLAPGMPPTLVVSGGEVTVFDPSTVRSDASPLAGHIVVEGMAVVVAEDGGVFIDDRRLSGVVALHDTRLVTSSNGLLALMSDPTERLRHAVLGDGIEAETVTVVDVATASVHAVLDAPDDTVFEAISPMWADVDGDGVEEIIVTQSDVADGARLNVFASDGMLIATSPPIGRGNRWLNQLGVAPLGPAGEIEVVEVRTPHIGGIVQWYQLDGDQLIRRAAVSGYSTHRIFSRNLDEGLIVDADGDGRLDVVVPSQDDGRLAVLTRTSDGAQVAFEVELGADLSSNLAAVSRQDGSASVAVGTAAGTLVIWP